MSAVLWFVAGAVAMIAAWYVFKPFLPFTGTDRTSGALLLRRELKRAGIPCDHLPEQFYFDCVDFAEKVSSVAGYGSNLKRKAEYVRTIENLAQLVAEWRREPNSPMFATHGGRPSTYRVLFEKYDLRRAS